jgi:energy-coupling factor transport system substrate-specific component
LLGPVTNVFYPPVVAIPNGIVMMLLLAKVPKKGVLTICGIIQGILFLLVGAFWFIPVSLVVGGVICDFLIMNRKEITAKSMKVAYTIFSGIFTFGAIGPIKFLQAAFVAATKRNGISQEYIDGLIRMTSVPMLIVIIAAGVVCGFLGGYLGQKMLKKHFIKAGLVSMKK